MHCTTIEHYSQQSEMQPSAPNSEPRVSLISATETEVLEAFKICYPSRYHLLSLSLALQAVRSHAARNNNGN